MEQKITTSTCAFGVAGTDEDGFTKHFEMAMEAGFSGFELCFNSAGETQPMIRAARKTGCKVIAVHGILNGGSCSPDPAVRDASVEQAYRYLADFAEFAPCPIVEHYWDRYLNPEIGRYFHDAVGKLLEKTESLGFLFCMENAPYKPEHNERFPNVAEVAAFARSYGENRMFMTFDVNHANLHEDPVKVCSDCAGLVRHIHVSDNHGIREEHLIPGTGIIDFSAVLSALYRNGYTGPCNLEFSFPKDVTPNTAAYRKVFDFMKAIQLA